MFFLVTMFVFSFYKIRTNFADLFATNNRLPAVVGGSGAVATDQLRQLQQRTRRPPISGVF